MGMEFNAYFLKACCAIGAGLCMGIGAIGPAIGEGNAVGREDRGGCAGLRRGHCLSKIKQSAVPGYGALRLHPQ